MWMKFRQNRSELFRRIYFRQVAESCGGRSRFEDFSRQCWKNAPKYPLPWDDYYPAIIDKELFDNAEEERLSRANQLGRVRELKAKETPAVPLHFTMGQQTKVIYDPFEQAEYAYSLIESEMNLNGTN